MITVTVEREHAKITLEVSQDAPIQFHDLLCDLERAVIADFLARKNGIKSRVAAALRLNRTTLVEKARKYGFPIKTMEERRRGRL